MATALQKQLAAIAASSTHQLDLKAQKSAHGKSLLFEPKIAASQSFETVYLICYEGFRDLCALDSRFLQFSKSLFSEQSKVEDRTQMTKEENKKLNAVVEAFITLVGPRLLLKPAQKAVEWLVRRFRVHEYNTECLALTYLPYHTTPQFLALLSILPSQPPPSLRFLHPYIQSPTNPPRRTIVYTAVNTPGFFNALQAHTVRVVKAGHQAPQMISFWSTITLEAVFGILENTSSGRRDIQSQKTEELVLRILPVLNSCMQAKYGAETVAACYSIVTVLAGRGELGEKVLDGLMEAVVLAHEADSLNACLQCLAVLAEQRSPAQLPPRVIRRLLKVPQLSQKLVQISKQCRVHRLTLGCALGALASIDRLEEQRDVFQELMASGLLTEAYTRAALAALVTSIRDSAPGSTEHGQLLDLAAQLAETTYFLDGMRAAAKSDNVDLESLGLTLAPALETAQIDNDEDEDMLDVDDVSSQAIAAPKVEVPDFAVQSFLELDASQSFAEVANAFERAVSTHQSSPFLASKSLGKENAMHSNLYLSLLARIWCSSQLPAARIAALRAAAATLKSAEDTCDFQNLIPYLLHALADPSAPVRRAAAACTVALSEASGSQANTSTWGSSKLYGSSGKAQKHVSQVVQLKSEDVSTLLSSILIPMLEESVMDPTFAIPAIREVLEGSKGSKSQPKHGMNAQTRTSILSFFASHLSLSPLVRIRIILFPIFNFSGKVSDTVRSNTILPLIQGWCTLPLAEASKVCDVEKVTLEDAYRGHLNALVAREAKSVQLLNELMIESLDSSKRLLAEAVFDKVAAVWPATKSEQRVTLARTLLDMSFKEGKDDGEKQCRERAIEILRNVKHDSATLLTFLESVPAAVQMPEGPPTKKRRRTSRNEMARVELASQDDVQRLLRKLTLVLELIEGSNPGQHPALFKSLFTVFNDLQPLKQQSGSELVYLQSMILGSLTPIVDTLKQQKDTADYQSSVRADLLIDCIRHSTSPQVQNSALLLIANLASWVPELILHNLMPIFTFIGSTLLRQQDDYSAQVVDKTISRVVPQLAASLRAKHKNFLTGVSDLLLSFTAAFEHIPLHRRLKLFSELARTLGPQDSLSAIISLLADRYHNGKTQRRFSTELLLVFDPIHTLDAIKGYLDLVVDAAGPKRKVSDSLFGLNDKTAAQVETAIKNLLVSLADLATDDRLRAHVTRAFRRKDDPARPREVFANIVETTIQLSKKVASSPKLYEACSRVLANCLDLLPTTDLVKSAELLLVNTDHQVQIAAIKAVELRAGNAVQNDKKSVISLISFLPSVEKVLQQSQHTDAKIISVGCIDRIVERFGKKDMTAVASIAQTIAGSQALSSGNDTIRVLSLLCLTSIVDVLEDEAIALLPTVLPTAFDYLSQAIEGEKNGLHNAVYSLLSNIVERLGYMFSRDYLETALRLSHRSAVGGLEDTCDESRRTFYQNVSEHLGAQETFAAIKTTWPHALSQGFEASSEHLELLRSTVDLQSKSKLIKASSTLFSLLLQLFKVRQAIDSQEEQEYDDEEIEQLDNTLDESALAMVLKLNDATFRPFFVQLVDQEGPMSAKPEYAVTFYKFLAAFFDKFKSIVTSYSSYIIDHAAKMLEHVAQEDADSELRSAVLGALQKSFQHDQDAFWQAPSHFGTILKPLVNLLTISATEEVTEVVIPTITDLAASSSSSIDNHRELNTILLRYMRSDSAATRLATVKCEQSLTTRLGEEWLGLLPEMLPFISELREDDDEMVERETQRWISQVEGVLGESLEGMLQ
ncbi:U3 small nucleolar RNA-associated protein 10 [Parastagonospora nodorum]|uniref:U3 small nucleolar RNA-associated protein 10 n=1 Tax=Phaeosphaeria nodorum (strain SN15 / ATCC MYA-4574 / FGSC 10173) TaxID=321614 RepID=A0A7U2ES16_PHANO|nr:U3 small nucleolar RNA-associated protein 10 [Parastagonospora nodorum]QRC92035.1 U3 small nucleolar RNA-associated protein 10 [Parastagonospora nodorum SN15]KAH3931013.1 U3 small nucleolar RNA-associated protein 10 [Parastagonospora nodorum]KAH4140762.1 U3 small nucleolar RNA-associated protein 10 [Parastagonospora nodorum]KAH4167693.1 U3 small nucleolar RNA-associated protein 10 [Parastagonospora nodorum]